MRKHLIGRRLLSLFVALALAVTVLPASPAFAQEEVVAEPVETSGQEEVTAEPAGEDVPDVPADDVSGSGQEEESLGAPAEQEYELSDNPNGDPLYGGEVVCRGISASVTEDTLEEDTHTLTIHIASAEAGKNMSTKGYTWTLYSPTTKAFAESVYSSVATARDVVHDDTSDLTAEGDDITLIYKADETVDYQLVCVYMNRQGTQIAGLLYTADNVTSLLKDGKFSFDVISQPTGNGSGIHVFSVRSNFFKSTDSVVLHTDANASNAAGRYEIAVDPDGELPRAIEVDLYHAFWGKDGQVMLGGYGEEEADVVASYNADNKMLEYSLLKKEYDFSARRSTRLYKTTDVQSIRLFALNDTTSAPISSAWERPEFIYASEAAVGTPGQKGYAVVDIDGTGTEGEVSLSTPKPVSYAAVNGARTIRVVDARIDNGRGQLEGVAELRIKYQSDGEAGDLFYGRLVPGYYNRETGEWETVPYLIDEENHEVVIFAEHFSIFGLFDADCSGTRTAFVKEADPARLANMRAKTAEVILAPYENQLPDPASGDIVGRTLAELDGYANGKIVFGTATFETLQSKLRKLDTGKFGKTMTAIGIAGAVLSVANNAYHKGFNDTDTLKAVVNLGANVTTASMTEIQAPVAWAAVVVGTASAIYQYHIESKQLVHNDQIDRLYTKWEQRQPWGKWKQKDWAKNVVDKQYNQYFKNGTGLPIKNYQDYISHLDTAISYYPHQFAVAYETGELERMFPGEMPTDNDFEGNLSYISDLCDYQTANLFLYLEPYLRAQSREAYCRAL
ncbi:MAG: hypothetical protein K6E16_00155, partial [Lachnospiraceae bacterium]|nr:hypothetical protein [Lachnospiraceae bacterium]